MKVLLVGKGPPDGGGIAAFIRLILESELARSHDLEFLNVAHSAAPEGGRVTAGNVRRTARDTAAVWKRAKGRDIVHIHSACAPGVTLVRAGLLATAARMRGCRVVVHAHGGRVATWLTNRPRQLFARVALLPANRVVAVSTGGRDTLARIVARERLELIDNGVDIDSFATHCAPHEPPRVLFVGTLTPRKGLLDLFEASRLLVSQGVVHELRIAGGTPDDGPHAEAEVRAAAPARTDFLGLLEPEAMRHIYADADILCLPSWWEAMPLSVLEAMAAALPVVASRVGDVPRLVDDGVTGFVVPAHEPAVLAAALGKLCTDATLAMKMGNAGLARVIDAFSSAACIQRLDRVYRSLDRP